MAASPPSFITVVSGVPRSGTSLMMQMLAAGGMGLLSDGIRGPDEHNSRGYFEYEPVRRLRRDASWIGDAVGRAVKVLHVLVSVLPPGYEYRLILMRRDLRAVVASQQSMLPRRSAAIDLLPADRLVEIFQAQLRELEDWVRAQPRFRLLRVDYASALAEPEPVAAEVGRFLGGGLDVEAMAGVADPTLRHQGG